jgi:hypothetical protein
MHIINKFDIYESRFIIIIIIIIIINIIIIIIIIITNINLKRWGYGCHSSWLSGSGG